MANNLSKKISRGLIAVVAVLFVSAVFVHQTQAAVLSVTPSTGTFTVGSTFDVPIYLNTQNQSINAVAVFLHFSPEKLQLVSPSSGRSIIDIWASPPQFNNQSGTVELQGLIPNGINTTNGQITTLTFRVKAVGQAVVKFSDESKVLLNDGLGTDVLNHLQNGIYQLALPPPAGPLVVSETHPDSSKWYANPNLILSWASSDRPIEGYSYILDNDPVSTPDDISEGAKTSLAYRNLSDGVHYFHIKALRHGSWGGLTHFAVMIDKTPPAEFKVDVVPSPRTTRRQPLIQFVSSDAFSGLEYYELKLVRLTPQTAEAMATDVSQPFFIEAQSPYLPPPLDLGQYDVIVRAYDRAGNYRETTERLAIVNALFKPIGERGLEIGGIVTLAWGWVWIIFLVIILFLWRLSRKIRSWHRALDEHRAKKILPAGIKDQLEELKRYREKYGKAIMAFVIFGLFGLAGSVKATDDIVTLSPPLVTTISRAITNEDIFYVGGKTEIAQTPVVIYFQNLNTGETSSQTVASDKQGEWFYTHNTFLPSGNYRLWTQAHLGEEWSPPSPEAQMVVRATALQFGTSRFSYAVLYLAIIFILGGAMVALVVHTLIHGLRGRKKRTILLKEVHEAEESVRRGFAILRRDIMAELAVIKKAKLDRELAEEEKQTEEHLLKDLTAVERYIGREIWEVEQAEG